jgi:hypothetical protein
MVNEMCKIDSNLKSLSKSGQNREYHQWETPSDGKIFIDNETKKVIGKGSNSNINAGNDNNYNIHCQSLRLCFDMLELIDISKYDQMIVCILHSLNRVLLFEKESDLKRIVDSNDNETRNYNDTTLLSFKNTLSSILLILSEHEIRLIRILALRLADLLNGMETNNKNVEETILHIPVNFKNVDYSFGLYA